jgi:hypothetical protein
MNYPDKTFIGLCPKVLIRIIYTEGDFTYYSNLIYDCLFLTSFNNNEYFVSFKKG